MRMRFEFVSFLWVAIIRSERSREISAANAETAQQASLYSLNTFSRSEFTLTVLDVNPRLSCDILEGSPRVQSQVTDEVLAYDNAIYEM